MRVIDPATNDSHVVIRAEVFARLAKVPQGRVDANVHEIPLRMLRSQQSFWRDLPEMLKDERNRRTWAAYQGRTELP